MKENQESTICAFIKAIDKKYYDSFINDGEICFNTAEWFREYESQDDNIGDAGEGAIISCGNDFTVKFSHPILSYSTEEDLKEQLKTREWSEPFKGQSLFMFKGDNPHILSLYAITITDNEQKDHKHLVSRKFIDEFSNHRFVLIKNPRIFTLRVAKALINKGKKLYGSIVSYYPFDSIMKNDLSYFDKREKYSYQNEYRIIFNDNNLQRQIVKIGSLNDICIELNLFEHSYCGYYKDLKLTIEMG